eukprot:TRINITY_DN7928_c0_g1_i12.p3 TRINITY_DN7928_c0_g1~~TRINITY_DN7928_c0_g1_i12.p3  ORF type:complete len:106 (+),score=19.32 TRINITY_DN7928_c0_g1_i12:31-318(+)
MIRRPPRSTHCISSAASDVYKRQVSTQSTWVAFLLSFFYFIWQFKYSLGKCFVEFNSITIIFENDYAFDDFFAAFHSYSNTSLIRFLLVFCYELR